MVLREKGKPLLGAEKGHLWQESKAFRMNRMFIDPDLIYGTHGKRKKKRRMVRTPKLAGKQLSFLLFCQAFRIGAPESGQFDS